MKNQAFPFIVILFLVSTMLIGCINENQNGSNSQTSNNVILTTNKNEYNLGEKLTLSIINNKENSVFNQGGPLPSPSPIISFGYGMQNFINDTWEDFKLVRGNLSKYSHASVIQVVVECEEYASNSTITEQVSLNYYVYGESDDYYEDIPPGKYRIIKSFYNSNSQLRPIF